MAKRFGGKHSPGATPAPSMPDRARRDPAGARVNILFMLPFLLVLTAFQQGSVGLAFDLAAFGDLMLAAWLTREGLIAEDAYNARRVARRPALPRKLIASVLTGSGLALAGLDSATFGLLEPAVFFVLGTVLHALAFGPDPLSDKGTAGMDGFQTERVARAVDEAEAHLSAMRDAIRRAGVPALERRVADFSVTAQKMFRVVEEDPRDLTGARRYLGVYLLGARDATTQFADLYARSKNQEARSDYAQLLNDLETSFSQKTDKLLLDDKSGLDVEIQVLRDRLAREGVKSEI